MEWIRNRKFSRTIIAALLLTMTAWFIPAGLMAEKAEAAVQLDDPVIRDTSQMAAGQKVTWDCVWFGSYPQSEVVCETDTERIGELTGGAYDNQYVTVSKAQWDKITGTKYNNYGDATVDGVKYKRVSKTDANYATSGESGYYEWGDDTVRYFRYEPIKWRVLNVNGTDAFLLADKALDDQCYNNSSPSITWETCTMRSWLNGYDSSSNSYGRDYTKFNFINTAFTSSERSAIKTTEVVNDDNIEDGTAGGNDTSDKVFLLSENEVYNSNTAYSYGFTKSYSKYDEGRRCKSSTFAKAMGVYSDTSRSHAGNCRWWLRSPGNYANFAAGVNNYGNVDSHGSHVYTALSAVRPALHLDLSSSDLYSYAGTVSSDGSMNEEGGGVVTPDNPDTPDKPVITEDQLFGEYADYLNNESYKNMCGEIRTEVEDDILWSRSDFENWFSGFKSCMKAGAWSNIKSIISGYSGGFYTEKQLEEDLALDLVQALSEDKNISDEIMSDVKSAHGLGKDADKVISTVLEQGFSSSSQKVKVAEKLSGGLFSKDDILVLIESAEENEAEWNKDLKNAGIAVDAANMAISIALTMEADHEIITELMASVDQDTPLYRGLSRIDKKLQHTAVENVIPELLKYGIDKCAGALADAASGAIAPVELGFKIIGAVMPTSGIEGVNSVVITSSNTAQLSAARDDMISKITLNYRNGGDIAVEDLKAEYEMIYRAYLISLDQSVKYALKIAKDGQKEKLQSDYDRIKKSLTYDKYIESCLANANADWSYEVRDGKAVIKSCSIKKASSAKKASAKKAAATAKVGYSLDIPDTIDGYSVASVKGSAFKDNSELKCVTIPDGVGELGSSAFASCTSLDTVYMGSGLKTIGGSAFKDCSSLGLVKLPYSVKEIGDDAFAGTSDLVIEAQDGTAGQDYAKNNSNVTFESVESRAVSISIETKPEKLSYKMSEDIDPAGMVVKARYEDGTEKDVTKYCYSTFIDKKPGTVSVEVRFNDIAVTYDVEVTADECEYTVRYENECGDEIADKKSAKAVAGSTVTLTAPQIKGYTLDDQELTKVIGADSEFVITYTSKPEKSIKDAEVTYKKKYRYTGKQIKPEVTITYGGKKLAEGEDYYIDYDTNTEPGKGGIMICGKGDYCGDLWLEFDISDGSIFGSESMIRIAGDNRYATSTAAADALKKSLGVDKFENIIVASGADYPDALAGSYLAKVKNAPVMLVGKDAETESDVKQYISKNLKKGGTVYLLGGTGVVTSRFEKSLGDLKVERLGGQTRYETNIAILKEAGVDKEDLLVCTGEGFADSLSASAVGKPILLVAGSGVNDTQKKYLGSLKINDIYLIGGTGVVSDKIGTQLKKYDQDDKCERVAGKNRYLTSVAVAEEFFPKGSDSTVLAYAMNFPDGLAGGPLALSIKAPLILTDNSGYSEAVAYAKNAGIKKAVVLGGPTLISDGVVNRIIN